MEIRVTSQIPDIFLRQRRQELLRWGKLKRRLNADARVSGLDNGKNEAALSQVGTGWVRQGWGGMQRGMKSWVFDILGWRCQGDIQAEMKLKLSRKLGDEIISV